MSADASSPVAAGVLERLRNARGFVFDLDGTLVLGDKRNAGLQPLPGRASWRGAAHRSRS